MFALLGYVIFSMFTPTHCLASEALVPKIAVDVERRRPSLFEEQTRSRATTSLEHRFLDHVLLEYQSSFLTTQQTMDEHLLSLQDEPTKVHHRNRAGTTLELSDSHQLQWWHEMSHDLDQSSIHSHEHTLQYRWNYSQNGNLSVGKTLEDSWKEDKQRAFLNLNQKLADMPLTWTLNPSRAVTRDKNDEWLEKQSMQWGSWMDWDVRKDVTWRVGGLRTENESPWMQTSELDQKIFSRWTLRATPESRFFLSTSAGKLEQQENGINRSARYQYELNTGKQLNWSEWISASLELRNTFESAQPNQHSISFSLKRQF